MELAALQLCSSPAQGADGWRDLFVLTQRCLYEQASKSERLDLKKKKGLGLYVHALSLIGNCFFLEEVEFRVQTRPCCRAPGAVKLMVKGFAPSSSGTLGGLGLNL